MISESDWVWLAGTEIISWSIERFPSAQHFHCRYIATDLSCSKHNGDSRNRLFNLKNIDVFDLYRQNIARNLFLSEKNSNYFLK